MYVGHYRYFLISTVALLAFVLMFFGLNGLRYGDLNLGILTIFGVSLGIWETREVMRERSILRNPRDTTATIVRVWFTRRGGRSMEYEFDASDGVRYSGTSSARRESRTGESIEILYSLDYPNQNFPIGAFWFHELERKE